MAASPQAHLARRLNGPADPPSGPAATPTLPMGGVPVPGGAAAVPGPPAIPLGEVTRRHLARVLEQAQAPLLLAVVEAAGGDPAARWRLVLDQARLEPEG